MVGSSLMTRDSRVSGTWERLRLRRIYHSDTQQEIAVVVVASESSGEFLSKSVHIEA